MNLPIICRNKNNSNNDAADVIMPTTINSYAKINNNPSHTPANDKESRKHINVSFAFDDLEWDFSSDVAIIASYKTKPYSTNSTNSPACNNSDT